jgi:hypothetical protein
MGNVRGWIVKKYEKREILKFDEYPGFSGEIKKYIYLLGQELNIGSDIIVPAVKMAGSVYWEAARPSTLAGTLIIMVGSCEGIDFLKIMIEHQRKMKYTYLEWIEHFNKNYGW